MEFFKPIASFKKKTENVKGLQHLLDGDNDQKYTYFRCNRRKPYCDSSRNCSCDKKVDDSAVGTLEVTEGKFKELMDTFKCCSRTNRDADTVDGIVVPLKVDPNSVVENVFPVDK